MSEPLEQDEWSTLEAELRQALQHRSAAYEQLREIQEEMRRLMERARAVLDRARASRGEGAGASTSGGG